MKITVHLCRDRISRKSSSEQPADPALLAHSPGRNTEDEALDRLDRYRLLTHLVRLPPHYHEVLYLYYYLDLSTREIAETTGSPEGTVRGRLHRARELLAECLGKEGLTS